MPLELAAVTVTPLYAVMATTGITRMPAHPMATTALIGLSAESLSAPARGSMDIGDVLSTAVLASMVAASMDVASTDDPDLVGVADLFAAARPAEASRAVGSAGARADSTAVVSAAADTDNSAKI